VTEALRWEHKIESWEDEHEQWIPEERAGAYRQQLQSKLDQISADGGWELVHYRAHDLTSPNKMTRTAFWTIWKRRES
jgi:hypothetical protein